jgi:hypothetical protein
LKFFREGNSKSVAKPFSSSLMRMLVIIGSEEVIKLDSNEDEDEDLTHVCVLNSINNCSKCNRLIRLKTYTLHSLILSRVNKLFN